MSIEARNRWAYANNEPLMDKATKNKEARELNLSRIRDRKDKILKVIRYGNRKLLLGATYVCLSNIIDLMMDGYRVSFFQRHKNKPLENITNKMLKSILREVIEDSHVSNEELIKEIFKYKRRR